jgi:hypothetical protein
MAVQTKVRWSKFNMLFAKRLREGVRNGEITCTVRIWMRQHVTVGGRYRMEEGEIEVDSIETIGFPDITPKLARESGFLGILDLLKVAKHGRGENIYLIRFHYVPPPRVKANQTVRKSKPIKTSSATGGRRGSSFREKSPKQMGFPHQQSRKDH